MFWLWPGASLPADQLDAGDPGQAALAPLVPRHHRHEQDEGALLRLQMTERRAGQERDDH